MNRIFALIFIAVCTLSFSSAEAATLKGPPSNNGLVGYWSFNEGTSTVVTDLSGSGNHGTLTNMDATSDWVLGKYGKALDFDGANDYVEVGDKSSLSFGNGVTDTAFSGSIWVYITDSTPALTMFMSKDSNTTSGREWLFYIETDNQLTMALVDDIGSVRIARKAPSTTYALNTWQHFAFTYDGSSTSAGIKIYVNGARVDSADFNANSYGALENTTSSFRIGSGNQSLNVMQGRLDEARIYNRALSETEVVRLYGSGQAKISGSQSVISNGLIGWWTFDGKDMTGGRVLDRGSLGKTGTVSGIATSTFYTLGKIGQALRFDGVDDYISLGTDTYTTAQVTAGTFTTWFKLDSFPANNTTVSLFDIEGYLGGQIYGASGAAFIRSRMISSTTGTTQLALNRWYHYAQTWDGTTAIAYLDGVAETSQSVGSPAPSSQTRLSTIGATYVPGSYFAGSMDDARLYNRALSADEVRQLVGANTSRAAVATNNGLVGYWSFNEGTSTLAGDFSGNGNTGTLTNMDATTDWVVGKRGKALDLDGVNDKVVLLVAADSFNAGWHQGTVTEGTFSAWIKTANYNQNNLLPIVSSSDGYSANRGISFEYDPRSGSSNRISWKISRGQSGTFRQHCYVTTALSDNEWTHFTAVVTASGVTFYKNGAAMAAATCAPGTASGTTTGNATYPLSMGGNDEGGFSFNGVIDEVRIYNRALTAAEVLNLYRAK